MENTNVLKTQIADYLGNHAELTGEALVDPCVNCNETIQFALRNKDSVFSIGLITVLECLSFAESQYEVPELPREWWISVINRYGLRR